MVQVVAGARGRGGCGRGGWSARGAGDPLSNIDPTGGDALGLVGGGCVGGETIDPLGGCLVGGAAGGLVDGLEGLLSLMAGGGDSGAQGAPSGESQTASVSAETTR